MRDRAGRDLPNLVRNASPLTFEDAYEVCGGCMHLLAETHEIFIASRCIVNPYSMSYLSQRRGRLYWALNVTSRSTWRSHVKEAMHQLIEAEYNYVPYATLCDKISQSNG